jgi:hypothetical protein
MPANAVIKENWYRYLGIALLGIASLCYAFGGRDFAELHVKLPFLNFPIFIGEWLLLVCSVLLGVLWKKEKPQLNNYHVVIGCYLVWLFIKAMHGYVTMGPLALRHSALFYYPLFALLGYYFYDKTIFHSRLIIILFLMSMIGALYAKTLLSYFRVPYFILYLLLAISLRSWVLTSIALLFLIKFPFKDVLITSRTLMISLVACFVFLTSVFAYFLWSSKKKYVHLAISSILLVAIVVAFQKVNPDALNSIFKHNGLFELYRQKEEEIAVLKKGFHLKNIKPQLYNNEVQSIGGPSINSAVDYILNDPKALIKSQELEKEEGTDVVLSEISSIIEEHFIEAQRQLNEVVIPQLNLLEAQKVSPEEAMSYVQQRSIAMKEEALVEIEREIRDVYKEKIQSSVLKDVINLPKLFEDTSYQLNNSMYFVSAPLRDTLGNSLETRYGNIIFRIYIWQDMWEDMVEHRAWIWGMNMGHPQRSKRLEMLQWAIGEWSRDGWITAHNSWYHMLYRGGMMGVALVFTSFFIWSQMIRGFLSLKSWKGILLGSILLYLMITACFLVILELPYNAIPFWNLFGFTLAYSIDLKKKRELRDANV